MNYSISIGYFWFDIMAIEVLTPDKNGLFFIFL